MKTQLKPMDIREDPAGNHGMVVFAAPGDWNLCLDIPHEQLAALWPEFQSYSQGPSLFELWAAGTVSDGQFTEVIVEVADDRAYFFLVVVSVGFVWRTPTDPVDALQVGFRLSLPFFLWEEGRSGRLPALLETPGATSPANFTWRCRTSFASTEC